MQKKINSSMKLNLVAAWFGTAATTLIFALLFLIYLSIDRINYIPKSTYRLYQALPESRLESTDWIMRQDARPKIIEEFFMGHSAPLYKHAETFVRVADRYNLDYRLLPSIAMQESNGGKKTIIDSFNPFGFGIYGEKVVRFSSWDEAIERVGKTLREEYLNKGLITPFEIMTKYTPPSIEKGGPWAKGVESFMYELK
jgi:hypothetical protein